MDHSIFSPFALAWRFWSGVCCYSVSTASLHTQLHCLTLKHPEKGRLNSTAVWVVPGTALYSSQRSALTSCSKCRQRRIACLLQHWHSWAGERGRLRQLGQMVHRGHQGFAMRHAWEHWHWIASCKVGPFGEREKQSSGECSLAGFVLSQIMLGCKVSPETVQHSTMKKSSMRYTVVQCSTVQIHSTISAQHSTEIHIAYFMHCMHHSKAQLPCHLKQTLVAALSRTVSHQPESMQASFVSQKPDHNRSSTQTHLKPAATSPLLQCRLR